MPKVDHHLLHAARGAVMGAAVADALVAVAGDGRWPATVMGGRGELGAPWSDAVTEMLGVAEDVARGQPVPFDVGPVAVLGAAVADGAVGDGAPLLVDPDAAEFHAVLATALTPDADVALAALSAGDGLGAAIGCSLGPTFESALKAAWETGVGLRPHAVVVGALAGARLGVTAIPSRWLTYVHGPGPGRVHYQRDLIRLADRLIGHRPRLAPDPRRRLGPVEVVDGVWAANLHRVASFSRKHPEGAIISMCPVADALDHHPVRRSFLIEDVATRAANPRLPAVLDELVASIDVFRREGRDVLVHCHHGVSRTGLALRAWLMASSGLSEAEATPEIEARWPWLSTSNERFTRLLEQWDPSGLRSEASLRDPLDSQ